MTKINEEAKIKISRSRIYLQRQNPFFAYLSLQLKPIEAKVPTMAVDIDGNLYYNPDFVNKLNDDEMCGVLIHEIMHEVLLHLTRGEKFNRQIGNISADICCNEILKDNNFTLPDGCIWSNSEREVTILGHIIKKANERTFEDIYWELFKSVKKQIDKAVKNGKVKVVQEGEEGGEGIDISDFGDYEIDGSSNDGKGKIKSIDGHIRGKKGKELSEEEKRTKEKEWLGKVMEAHTIAKMRGEVPEGIERLVGQLHQSKVNWKNLLLRYVQSYIPSNYNYAKPNKKSISSGFYMPDIERECIDIVIATDTSGSIGQDELVDFVSEIIGLGRAYRGKIKMTLLSCDAEVNEVYKVENGDVERIKKNVKMKGGGGTAFLPVIEWVKKNKRDAKLLLYLTDGYGEKIEKPKGFDIIWVLSKNGSDELLKDSGRVIKLK